MKIFRSTCVITLLLLSFFVLSCGKDSVTNEPDNTDDLPADTDKAFSGYTLFNPNGAATTYLIDMEGNTVHTWNNSRGGGYAVYLLENGNILRPASLPTAQLQGGAGAGLIQEIDWDGNVVWNFEYSGATYLSHHDIEPLPNGNILLIAWEVKTAANSDSAGYSKSSEIWTDHLIEVQPTGSSGGEIVWEWHAWDHMIQDHDSTKENFDVVADHPELLDINIGGSSSSRPGSGNEWLHINGISYNEILDQIVISSHFTDEFYVIDHSTTTEEAAGHTGGNSGKGGDILFRWGRPQNYDASGTNDFDVIHCSLWIPEGVPGAGNIIVFNNGEGRRYSEVVEIAPPVDMNGNYTLSSGSAFGPAQPTWSYSNGTSFYSNHLGSCQRLPNGNTLISESTSGYLFEVTSSGEIVWDFEFEKEIARSLRYAPDYAGLSDLKK